VGEITKNEIGSIPRSFARSMIRSEWPNSSHAVSATASVKLMRVALGGGGSQAVARPPVEAALDRVGLDPTPLRLAAALAAEVRRALSGRGHSRVPGSRAKTPRSGAPGRLKTR
jgi:hypothetical protein